MQKLGGTMFFFGVGSILLGFINMQFIILSWVDLWGPEIGWAIKGGLIVIGGALWLLGGKKAAA